MTSISQLGNSGKRFNLSRMFNGSIWPDTVRLPIGFSWHVTLSNGGKITLLSVTAAQSISEVNNKHRVDSNWAVTSVQRLWLDFRSFEVECSAGDTNIDIYITWSSLAQNETIIPRTTILRKCGKKYANGTRRLKWCRSVEDAEDCHWRDWICNKSQQYYLVSVLAGGWAQRNS